RVPVVVRAADAPPAAADRRADRRAVRVRAARRRREIVTGVAETLERREAWRAAGRIRRRDGARLRARRVAEVDRQRRDLRTGVRAAIEARVAPEEVRRAAVHVTGETGVRSDVARAAADSVVRGGIADALRTRIRVRTRVDAR